MAIDHLNLSQQVAGKISMALISKTGPTISFNIKIFYFNGVNVAKHWHVAGRGICHL